MTRKTSRAPDFEQSIAALEALVEKLEQGDLPLEEALKNFENGVALTRQCQSALKAAQSKVEILVAAQNKSELEPFDDDSDAADGE
ncbi:MAG: exodeoxyribonuclease VII small subunit [Steroidobacteraceae bacterium]